MDEEPVRREEVEVDEHPDDDVNGEDDVDDDLEQTQILNSSYFDAMKP